MRSSHEPDAPLRVARPDLRAMTNYAYLLPGGRLAQGSAPPLDLRAPFDVVVLAAKEYQPNLPGYEVMRVPLDTWPTTSDSGIECSSRAGRAATDPGSSPAWRSFTSAYRASRSSTGSS